MPTTAQDRHGGTDHPQLPRYPGATIVGYREPSVDVIPSGPVADENAATNRKTVEGRVTHIHYRITPATAPLAIERHYAAALAAANFRIVYSCAGPACGRDMGSLILDSGKVAPVGLADELFNDRVRVMVANRGGSWALVHIAEGPDRAGLSGNGRRRGLTAWALLQPSARTSATRSLRLSLPIIVLGSASRMTT